MDVQENNQFSLQFLSFSKKLVRNVSQVLASYSSKVANVEIFNAHYAAKVYFFKNSTLDRGSWVNFGQLFVAVNFVLKDKRANIHSAKN